MVSRGSKPRNRQRALAWVAAISTWVVLVASSACAQPRIVSNIKTDEMVQLFGSSAYFVAEQDEWHVPVHAWVYEPTDSALRAGAFRRSLTFKYGLQLAEEDRDNFYRRVNLLIADSERGKRLVIALGDQRFVLPETNPRGQVFATLRLSEDQVEAFARQRQLPYSVVMPESDSREFKGRTLLVPPKGLSVISDIDDTVKVTGVTDHGSLLDYTFFREFEAVPGMASLYQRLHQHDVAFHFVSSSPWQLYPPLHEFLESAGFPPASVHLKTVRFRDRSFFDLFRSGEVTKPRVIEHIFAKYPERKFILIGDNGEEDPEVYAHITERFPQQVQAIFIRNVTGASIADPRYQRLLERLELDAFVLFQHPEQLWRRMDSLGLVVRAAN